MLPSKLYLYGGALLALLLTWGGSMWWAYDRGEAAVTTQWQASITADAVAQTKLVQASDLVTARVVTQYVDRVQIVLTAGATITKEVTHVITPQIDAAYRVPYGFVRVLNAAASGQALDAVTTTGVDDAPAPIGLSGVASGISDNLTRCRANAAQLASLQQWVTDQQGLTP